MLVSIQAVVPTGGDHYEACGRRHILVNSSLAAGKASLWVEQRFEPLLRYYSLALLKSKAARQSFIAPDRAVRQGRGLKGPDPATVVIEWRRAKGECDEALDTSRRRSRCYIGLGEARADRRLGSLRPIKTLATTP